MAITDILKSSAQGILGKNLRRVAGNLGTLAGGSQKTTSSDFEGITRSKTATKMLSFPIDVANADPATGGNHGHYIMFEINEQVSAKLKFGDVADSQGGIDTASRKKFFRYLEEQKEKEEREELESERRVNKMLADIENEKKVKKARLVNTPKVNEEKRKAKLKKLKSNNTRKNK